MRGHHSPFGYALLVLVGVIYIHVILEVIAVAVCAGLLLRLAFSPAPRVLLAWAQARRQPKAVVGPGPTPLRHELALVASAAKGYAWAQSDPRTDPSAAVATLLHAERRAQAAGIPHAEIEQVTRDVLNDPENWTS